uniref:HMG box domain-containing protein n=1 Tax=Hyaloperonospora arabidopsidis (strain Emoy2) TaxID=559515 RepID=M4BJB0_HYAAE
MVRGAVGRPKKAPGDHTRKPRKKKDKNAPKRALSAFMFFSNDIRDTVKKEMPELQFLEISSEIGRRWKKITDEERRPYDELAAADKRRYMEEKEDYVPDPSFETTKGTRKKKDPNAPKRALRPVTRTRARRSRRLPRSWPRVARAAGQKRWRALPDKKRVKYQKMHEEAKVKYLQQMDVYNSNDVAVQEPDEVDEDEEDDEDDE